MTSAVDSNTFLSHTPSSSLEYVENMREVQDTHFYGRVLLACLYARINLAWNRSLPMLWFLPLYIKP